MSGTTFTLSTMFVLSIASLSAVPDTRADNTPEKFMDVKLILSDSQVFTNDGLAYKVVITNISRSLITICGPTLKPKFACVIEGKAPGEDWQEIWDYPKVIKSTVRAPINIPAGSTWAEYGQVFLTKGMVPVFAKEGNWELRARVKTVIGDYASEPVSLDVKPWPKGEEPVGEQFQELGQWLLNIETIPSISFSKELKPLCQRHSSGGVPKTLKLILAVESYAESGEVAGKAASWSEAFKALSVGLDEVRHDQLARIFAFGAMKQKQWKDVAFLVEQVSDESAWLRSRRSELETVIQKGEFRAP
jgi:hypothetical protein